MVYRHFCSHFHSLLQIHPVCKHSVHCYPTHRSDRVDRYHHMFCSLVAPPSSCHCKSTQQHISPQDGPKHPSNSNTMDHTVLAQLIQADSRFQLYTFHLRNKEKFLIIIASTFSALMTWPNDQTLLIKHLKYALQAMFDRLSTL